MLSNWFRKAETVQPYSQLAYIYDFVMRHVDYHRWANFLYDLFLKAEVEVKEILDISCGTGNLLLELSYLNLKLAGFDIAEDMVRLAKLKLKKSGLPAQVWRGSMQHFHVKKRFHAALCTYDSLNYCRTEEACQMVFENVAAALVPGGVFVFDISTARNSRKYFRNYHEKEAAADFEYIRDSYYLLPKSEQVNEFTIRWNSRENKVFHEIHRQRIYKIAEIIAMIPADRFNVMGIYDGFSSRPGTERSDRVHFLLKRI